MTTESLMMGMILSGIYIFPLAIAYGRDHHQQHAIAVLNVALGWTAIGWLLALIWAATAVRETGGHDERSTAK